jgi:S-adenosylmethionine-diacylglycerol 3-amino-3-carboxypropyl transferase
MQAQPTADKGRSHRMDAYSNATRWVTAELLQQAVHRNSIFTIDGLRERAFTRAFQDLVYPQIWEDPLVDLEALEITPEAHVVAIASGGCNVLSYLVADPRRITAVDLNSAHVALTRLKLAAARHLESHTQFYGLFGDANGSANVAVYDRILRPRVDHMTRGYWDSRDRLGRRRIEMLARGFYRYGLLGRFITAVHLLGRALGADPRQMLAARTVEEQRQIYARTLERLFKRRLVRWLLNRPASLFGLGIPPAQYRALAGNSQGGMAEVIEARLSRLACGFDLKDNYFAWQAFGQGYAPKGQGALPPYLEAANFAAIQQRAARVDVRLVNLTEHLSGQPEQSVDRYVLLDAQDWMTDADLTALWSQITRTARPGARVIFRTAATETLLPERVPRALLSRWRYEAARSAELHRRDRSAIYGGFHLYVLRGEGA